MFYFGTATVIHPGEYEGRGQSAPRKFWGRKRKCLDYAGQRIYLASLFVLGIAFLLSDEGFQKTLCLEVGVPNMSKGRMLTP